MSNSSALDKRTPILLDTDVLVVGGGAAGVAAAVTAARQGLRVLLLERYGFCGGGAVAGLSGTICGLYKASGSAGAKPQQLVHGFVDEFIKVMEQKGGLTGPVQYGKTFTRVHDPLVWREAADYLLCEAGVKVLLHTVVTEVLLDGRERVAGVSAYSKQGKLSVKAKLTIDASGDADVIAMAGLPSSCGDNGKVQNPTMIFRMMGVDIARFLDVHGPDSIMGGEISSLIQKLNTGNEYRLPPKSFSFLRLGRMSFCATRPELSVKMDANLILFWPKISPRPKSKAVAKCGNMKGSSRNTSPVAKTALSMTPEFRSACAKAVKFKELMC